jgi:hypothetical protein
MYTKHVRVINVIDELNDYVIKHDLPRLEAELVRVREAARKDLWVPAASDPEVMALCTKMFLDFHREKE